MVGLTVKFIIVQNLITNYETIIEKSEIGNLLTYRIRLCSTSTNYELMLIFYHRSRSL